MTENGKNGGRLARRILLAGDGSDDANAAARAAADLARLACADLHVVHVWQPSLVPLPGEAGETAAQERAQSILERMLDAVRARGAHVAVGHLRSGRAADEILACAEEIDADLVVVGSRGLGALQRTVVGSVSEAVVHHSTRPVLVLRAVAGAWPPVHVVIGDDASADARKAGELAARIGKAFGTDAVVVRALSTLPRMLDGDSDSDAHTVDDALDVAEVSLASRARELEPMLGQRPHVHVAIDDPAAALVSVASSDETPALIAVGTRGLGALQRWRFGSVSTDVLRSAPGAVLINAHPRDTRDS
ncbi:MAG TPA: universal stress protein [Candidatus Dormibacteraeota bacterium]|nr:universal stress protein [Candidatus Dormibacteraeota bacterium]